MGWEWNPSLLPIHVYCFQLWEDSYRRHLYDNYEHFLVPVYIIIYKQQPIRISTEAMQAIKEIGDWYIEKHYTYIRIYGSIGAPHLLLKYIPKKLLIRETAYQTVDVGVTSLLSLNSKRYWPKFPTIVGVETLLKVPHAKKGAKALKEFNFMHKKSYTI